MATKKNASKSGSGKTDAAVERTEGGLLTTKEEAVTGLGASRRLAVGDPVSVQIGKRRIEGTVMAVHGGNRGDTQVAEDIGLQEIPATIDVRAFTGNPDRGGYETFTGIPLDTLSLDEE